MQDVAFAAVGEDNDADIEKGIIERHILNVEAIPIPLYARFEILKWLPILWCGAVCVPQLPILGDTTDMNFFRVFNISHPTGGTHKVSYIHCSLRLHFLPMAP